MFKSLSFFWVAVFLITSAKLIQVNFYEILGPRHYDDKEYHGEESSDDKEDEHSIPGQEDPDPTITIDTLANEVNEAAWEAETIEEEVVSAQPEESTAEPVTTATNTSSTPSPDSFFQNLKNSYLGPILADLPEGRSREDIVVRYYKHQKDASKVYTLRKLGYYLHEREAQDSKDYGSNVLYYGSDVDLRDIQLVAYTLVQNGVPLKAIKQSQYDWKYNAIEIGADSLLANNPLLSVADIQGFNFN